MKSRNLELRRLRWVWEAIKQRCYNPNSPDFVWYGARGITMCDRWRESFEAFRADVQPRPPGASLDRCDNDGPYAPENVRWASARQQAENSRRAIQITDPISGRTMLVLDWARELGMSPTLIYNRLRLGWDPSIVLQRPLKHWNTKSRERQTRAHK